MEFLKGKIIEMPPELQADIRSKNRHLELVYWRLLIAQNMRLQLHEIPEIAKALNHNRTTIYYYLQVFDDYYRYDRNFRKFVDSFK